MESPRGGAESGGPSDASIGRNAGLADSRPGPITRWIERQARSLLPELLTIPIPIVTLWFAHENGDAPWFGPLSSLLTIVFFGSLIFGTISAIVSAALLARTRVRTRSRDACPSCGYPTRDSAEKCPECGEARPTDSVHAEHEDWAAFIGFVHLFTAGIGLLAIVGIVMFLQAAFE